MFDGIRLRPEVRPVFLFIAACAVLVLTAPAARAGGISVTTTDDELNSDGDCSLREAIAAANTDTAVDACPAGSGADIIHLPTGTYLLTLGELEISADLTLVGANRTDTRVDASTLSRVFMISANPDVHFSDVTITGGYTDLDGAGVHVASGAVTFNNSRVGGNATGSGFGGGIYVVTGTVTLTNSRVDGNYAYVNGGGFYIVDGTVVLEGSRVDANYADVGDGGGLSVVSGTIELTKSRVDANYVDQGDGGGIHNFNGIVTLDNSRVDGNFASGVGGGIYASFGAVILAHSQVSDNISTSAGGIFSSDELTLVNSTISTNSAETHGGGLYITDATADLYNTTIAANIADFDNDDDGDGGGVYISESGVLTATHSLIAHNFDGSSLGSWHPDCSGTLTGAGYNLITDTTGCTLDGDVTGNIITANPGLGQLRNNGGPTLTHALLPGSPAIDAGNPAGCLHPDGSALTTDQRGSMRPADGDDDGHTLCDIGAYEFLAPDEPTPTAFPTATATSSPTATATQGPSPTPTNTVTPGPSPTPTITVPSGPSPTPTATFDPPARLQQRLYLPFILR